MKQYDLFLNEDRIPYLKARKSFDFDSLGDSPRAVHELLSKVFNADNLPEEHMYLICMDSKLKISGVFELAHGTVNTTLVHPREIFKRAIMCNAVSIIVSHTHPSGDPYPSNEDMVITQRIKEVGEIIGIPLVDHVIIGDHDYVSFQELGIL